MLPDVPMMGAVKLLADRLSRTRRVVGELPPTGVDSIVSIATSRRDAGICGVFEKSVLGPMLLPIGSTR